MRICLSLRAISIKSQNFNKIINFNKTINKYQQPRGLIYNCDNSAGLEVDNVYSLVKEYFDKIIQCCSIILANRFLCGPNR